MINIPLLVTYPDAYLKATIIFSSTTTSGSVFLAFTTLHVEKKLAPFNYPPIILKLVAGDVIKIFVTPLHSCLCQLNLG